MATLAEKIALFVGATAHRGADQLLNLDRVDVVKQCIRKTDDQKKELKRQRASQQGRVDVLNKKMHDTRAQIEKNLSNADFMLHDDDPNNDVVAERLVEETDKLESQAREYETEYRDVSETVDALSQSITQLEARQEEYQKRLRVITSNDKTAEANKQAAKSLAKTRSFLDDDSPDNLLEASQENAAYANRLLQEQLGQTTVQEDTEAAMRKVRVQQRIAELRGHGQAPRLNSPQ